MLLVSIVHTKIALVVSCANFYNCQAALLFPLVGSHADRFLFEAIARTTRSKLTWRLQDTK